MDTDELTAKVRRVGSRITIEVTRNGTTFSDYANFESDTKAARGCFADIFHQLTMDRYRPPTPPLPKRIWG